MRITFASRSYPLLFTLAALPFVVGSSCVVVYSSGNHRDDDRIRDPEDPPPSFVATGQFSDPVVAGLTFVSGSISGVTDASGEFQYEPGEKVLFSIGDVQLGSPTTAKSVMSVADLVSSEGDQGDTSEVNVRRLLQSLDAAPDSAVVDIPSEVSATAVTSNESVSYAIEFMDFSDDAAFANAASQLVAVLTADYPFTATLLDADALPVRTVAR